ncbi:MAG: LLM class F420-dependent oxidoreductase [Chloroflexota bacterium]|nr:LLM class F420-dependent oxidoreductase [Chloroflexota bacterium]
MSVSQNAAPLFSYHMPNFSFPGVPAEQLFDHVVALAQAAESAGFDLVTVMDHFYQIGPVGPETEPMLEAYSTLAALAARTGRVRLGTQVTGVTYRNPALLAKTVTTLDIISKGRAILGIGAAWNEAEHLGYGFDFPPVPERMNRLDEALTIIRLMFREERPSFAGRFYRIDRALNQPRPIQPGGPKILVGGGGEKRTLRLAARHADMTHWFSSSVEAFKQKARILEQHCQAEGRDPSTIVRLIGAPLTLARDDAEARDLAARIPAERLAMAPPVRPEQASEILHDYMHAGVQGFTFNNPMLATPELLAAAGEVKRTLGTAAVWAAG